MPRKDQWAYNYEYTDTFGGETNYCWVKRGTVIATTLRGAMRMARSEIGLSGVRGDIVADFGNESHWIPRGCCTILMVTEADSMPEKEAE